MQDKQEVMRRIMARVKQESGPLPSKCWIWTGARVPDGYGVIRISSPSRSIRVHRAMWQIHNGDIPAMLHVLHRCDTPSCCNPDHLFLGSNLDNIQDRHSKGRDASGVCNGSYTMPNRRPTGIRNGAHTKPWARPKGERHGFAKNSDADVALAIERYAEIRDYTRVAREFGVTRNCIKNWVVGRCRAALCRIADQENAK